MLTAMLIGLVCAACGEPYFVMHEEYLSVGEEPERYLGGSCEQIQAGGEDGTGAGGDNLPPYSIAHKGADDGVLVQVSDGQGRGLVSKFYDEEFLASGAIDEFEVRIAVGSTLRLKYWGGTSCEPIKELE